MATKKELESERAMNALLKDNAKLVGQIKDLREEQVSINFSDTQTILDIVKANKERTLFESEILKSAKALNKAYLDNATGLTSISKLQRSIDSTQQKLNKSLLINSQIRDTLGKKEKEKYDRIYFLESEIDVIRTKAIEKQDRINQGKDKAINSLSIVNKWLKEANGLEEERDDLIANQLNKNTQLLIAQENLSSSTKEQLKTLKAIDKVVPEKQRDILSFLSKLPIVGDVAKDILQQIDSKILEVLEDPSKFEEFKENFEMGDLIKKNLINPLTLTLGAITAITLAFSKINVAQTNLRRNLGESYDVSRNLSSEFSTVADTLVIANSLVEQFGFNVNDAFSGKTVLAASELVEAVGLTAEQAGQLAFLTTISGKNLNDSLDSAVKTVNPLLSQKQILQQVGQVSAYIALNFDNQVESLVRAASQAKELGLELNQVNQIADSLLDIESSIAAEFEAEQVTGKQLNFERARFFALTNNLVGLTEEIARNQEIINAFATGTRIEQQAIAGAIGLGTDELAKMVQEQQLLGSLSEKERKAKELADIKSLDLQNRLSKVLQTIAEESVVILEPISIIMKGIAGLIYLMIDGFKALKVPLTIIGGLAAAYALSMQAAAIGAGLAAVFLNPYGAIAGALIGAGLISRLVKEATPMAKGGIVTSPTFAMIGEAGPEAVIPLNKAGIQTPQTITNNIKERERNTNTTATISENQMNKLITGVTKAVMEGAEKGTSKAQISMNLDGNTFARGFDSYLAVNTRKYNT